MMEIVEFKLDKIRQYIEENKPPAVPYDFAVIRPDQRIQSRYRPFSDDYSWSWEQLGQTKSIVVIVLYTDVAADYYIREALVPSIGMQARREFGRPVFYYDDYMLLRKELCVLAGLGWIGKNALFFSRKFGFNCKLDLMLTDIPFDSYSEIYTGPPRLESCENCSLCQENCPASAINEFVLEDVYGCCEYVSDFNDERRYNICRKCIEVCPASNQLLEKCHAKGAPRGQYFYTADACDETLLPE